MTVFDIKKFIQKFMPSPYLIRMTRGPSGIDGRLFIYIDSLCHIAEQFRILRTNVYFLKSEKPVKILAVTSAEPGDGKTTVACNLAAALALDKKKVLLIDGDLRQPSVHEFFGLSLSMGLTEVLQMKGPPSDKIYKKTVVENLFVMSAGETVLNTAELLGHSGLKSNFDFLLALLRPNFDYIIVDTPPSRIITDGCLMAAACDAAILVVKANVSQKDSVEETANQLRNIKVNLAATVLMNCPAQSKNYYGYGTRSKEF